MSTNSRQETLIEQEVTYTLEINGNFLIETPVFDFAS